VLRPAPRASPPTPRSAPRESAMRGARREARGARREARGARRDRGVVAVRARRGSVASLVLVDVAVDAVLGPRPSRGGGVGRGVTPVLARSSRFRSKDACPPRRRRRPGARSFAGFLQARRFVARSFVEVVVAPVRRRRAPQLVEVVLVGVGVVRGRGLGVDLDGDRGLRGGAVRSSGGARDARDEKERGGCDAWGCEGGDDVRCGGGNRAKKNGTREVLSRVFRQLFQKLAK
jgi:hypothetical protein